MGAGCYCYLPSRLRVRQSNRVSHAPGMAEGWPGAIPTPFDCLTGLGVGARFRQALRLGKARAHP